MEWYRIIGFVVLWFVGLYLRGKFYDGGKDIIIMIVGGGGVNREDVGKVSFMGLFLKCGKP
jgi:hypothetical protein